MPLPRQCPTCGRGLTPMATTPVTPDAWVRGSQGEGWTFSKDPPHGHEVASTIGFRCADCRKVLRLILAPDRR